MIFSETQRFRQPWLWVMFGLLWVSFTGIFVYGIYRQVIHHIPFGSNPMSDTGLMITSIATWILLTAILMLFLTARLDTRIDREGIHYRFFPIHKNERHIAWKNISYIRIVSYHPIRQFGGWGIRYGKDGVAFNVAGKRGLVITRRGGERILIGTQKANELKVVLSHLSPLPTGNGNENT